MLNSVAIQGRLVAAPIPRGQGDKLAAAFSLAVQRDYKDSSGERPADFVDCVAFGKLGEFALKLTKGKRYIVRGRLCCSSYTAQDGTQRRCVQVVCDDLYFCEPDLPASASPNVADDIARQLDALNLPY